MQISDLISIGKLGNAKQNKGLILFRPNRNFKREYLSIRDVFLVFTDKRVRLVTLDKVSEAKEIYLSFLEKEIIAEIKSSVSVEMMITRNDMKTINKQDTDYDPVGKIVVFEGRKIGVISDVFFNNAQDVLVIKLEDGKEIMVPDVAEFVLCKESDTIFMQKIKDFFDL